MSGESSTTKKKPEEEDREEYLMWECFLNWSVTLQKIEKGIIPAKQTTDDKSG